MTAHSQRPAVTRCWRRALLLLPCALALPLLMLFLLAGPHAAAAPLAGIPTEVIVNGDFEDFDYAGWNQSSYGYIYESDDGYPPARSGIMGARLDAADANGVSAPRGISQTVTMPPSDGATLTYYYMSYCDNCGGQPRELRVRYTAGDGSTRVAGITPSFSAQWLQVTVNLGSYPTERQVTIEFLVSSPYPYSDVLIDDVSLIADARPAFLSADPQVVSGRAQWHDTAPITRTLRIVKSGIGTIAWNAAASHSWIGLSTLSGTDSQTITVELRPEGLGPAKHSGSINVTSPGQPNLLIPVQFHVRGNTDVGVIPARGASCGALERLWITMDEEDDGPLGGVTGWPADIDRTPHMTFVFCRADGSQYKPLAVAQNPGGKSLGYALLKLGHDCPDGSYEFLRHFDNQDTTGGYLNKNENKNSAGGRSIYPNSVAHSNTMMYFCYFPGSVISGPLPATHMASFPAQSFTYGVFANSFFIAALDPGSVWVDDENNGNKNYYTVDPALTPEQRAEIMDIIVVEYADTTVLHTAKVYDAPAVGSDSCLNPPLLFCKRPVLLDAFPLEIGLEDVRPEFCPAAPRPIDLSISLHHNPAAAQRADYEALFGPLADAIFEASNGVHVLRDVIIYTNNHMAGSAKVRWLQRGHPVAMISGYHPGVGWGGQLQMFDVFVDRNTNVQGINFVSGAPNDALQGGYVLAHEMGHSFYGLADEYAAQSRDLAVSPSIMNAQGNAVVLGNSWLNFSLAADNPGPNNQFRTYGAAGWPTLLRDPRSDPRQAQVLEPFCDERYLGLCADWDERIKAYGRVCMPEFGWVAPGATHRIDLPSGTARDSLNIHWWGSDTPAPLTLVVYDDKDISSPDIVRELDVDSDVDRLDVSLSHNDPGGEEVILIIRRPDGQEHDRLSCKGEPGSDKQTTCSISIDPPFPGVWKVEVDPPYDLPVDLKIDVVTTPIDGTPLRATVDVAGGPTIAYPSPALVIAQVGRDLPLTGIGIDARVTTPTGQSLPLGLRDDGAGSDATAGDGRYTGTMPYTQGGDHSVRVVFDNRAGTAAYTSAGYADGGAATPTSEQFERTISARVTITGFQPDDHSIRCANATLLPIDGPSYPGRIDFAGDVDFFAIDPAQPARLGFRIDSMSAGMLPRLRLLDSSGARVLKDATVDPASGLYLLATADVPAGSRICIEVTHQNPQAQEGSYWISVGSLLESEAGLEIITSMRGVLPGGLVTESLDWEVKARVGEMNSPGTGIDHVVMSIIGPGGALVYERRENTPAYCAFDGNSCRPWVFAERERKWPNGQAIESGPHILRATIFLRDGRIEVIERTIVISLSGGALYLPMIANQ